MFKTMYGIRTFNQHNCQLVWYKLSFVGKLLTTRVYRQLRYRKTLCEVPRVSCSCCGSCRKSPLVVYYSRCLLLSVCVKRLNLER